MGVRSLFLMDRKVLTGISRKAGQGGHAMAYTHLQQTVDATHGELQACPGRTGCGLLLVALLVSHGTLGTLARQTLGSLSRHGCSLNNRGSEEKVEGLVGRLGSEKG